MSKTDTTLPIYHSSVIVLIPERDSIYTYKIGLAIVLLMNVYLNLINCEVYVYVCVFFWRVVFVFLCTHTYVCICMCAYICVCMYMCVRVYVYACVCMYECIVCMFNVIEQLSCQLRFFGQMGRQVCVI